MMETAGHRANFELTKYTPYLALTDELQGVFQTILEKNYHGIPGLDCSFHTIFCKAPLYGKLSNLLLKNTQHIKILTLAITHNTQFILK